MSRKHLLAAAAVAALGLAAGGAHADAFQNGSFELGTFSNDGNGADTFNVGATAITGWSAVGVGNISWDVGTAFGLAPDDGSHYVDLTGYSDLGAGGWGGVAQSFTTVAGATYSVTFDLGTDFPYANAGSGLTVAAGNASDSFLNFDADHTGRTIWAPETFSFKATGATSTLSFIGNSGAQFVGLDNVAVTETAGPTGGVPEPASWALMILGFGGAGAALRRRRSVLATA
jgi:hypothetical protein